MDHIIDAKGKILGRLASEIAFILQGKKHANYEQQKRGDDRVIIKNVGGLVVSGGKEEKKIYYHHTGYMGHLREKLYKEKFKQAPDQVLRRAVENMLPRNFLRDKRLRLLKIEK